MLMFGIIPLALAAALNTAPIADCAYTPSLRRTPSESSIPTTGAPIFIATKALGYEWGPALVVFMGMLFPILTSTMFGVQRIDPGWIDASKTLGASQGMIFTKVVLPASVPYILNGLKTALGIGWMCIVAAEIFATSLGGIGFFVYEMALNFYWDYAFAGIIVIAVLGLLTTGVAEQVSKYVSRRMGLEA